MRSGTGMSISIIKLGELERQIVLIKNLLICVDLNNVNVLCLGAKLLIKMM